MTTQSPSRIEQIQEKLRANNLAAYVLLHSDPHQSEYPLAHYLEREAMTGFSGSSGDTLITQDGLFVWTDSRYYLQVAIELEFTPHTLLKLGEPDTPSIGEFISKNLPCGSSVALNDELISVDRYLILKDKLSTKSISLHPTSSFLEEVWTDRPPLPSFPLFVHNPKFVTEPTKDRLNKLQATLVSINVDKILITALDEIAWLLNLRGSDIPYNPVFQAFLTIKEAQATFYCDLSKVEQTVIQALLDAGIETLGLSSIYTDLASSKGSIGIIGNQCNHRLFSTINSAATIRFICNPIPMLKSIKNASEINHIKDAMVADGVALVRSFIELEKTLETEGRITEHDIAKLLIKHRSANPYFVSESFPAIVGYASNGAIIHYRAKPDTAKAVQKDAMLLVDSGAQYENGTTDITRTFHFGTPTLEEKTRYTLVLKGLVALSSATFPKGTNGAQLDTIARKALWDNGLNYGHGTGHGVGYFLNVHEGPQAIRPNGHQVAFAPGMITSNEPGYYKDGEYGIRLENIIHCIDSQYYDGFYTFENLTLFPFESRLILKELLLPNELIWLNDYHQVTLQKLSEHLSPSEKQWLEQLCAPL